MEFKYEFGFFQWIFMNEFKWNFFYELDPNIEFNINFGFHRIQIIKH